MARLDNKQGGGFYADVAANTTLFGDRQFDQRPPDRVFSRVSPNPVYMDQNPIEDMKFETALGELENIVASMEGGKLELEASIAAYRRGMQLMQHCQGQLTAAEAQIRILENGEFKNVDRNTLEAP